MTSNDLFRSRYPRGWFCLGLSRELQSGDLRTIDAFGTKLVMYRGEDGIARVLDGYCPHMGAELGIGCVKGNNVQCAFHHWEFGGDGACAHIPYARQIPSKAHVAAWTVREVNQLILVWHDADGSSPDYEIPRIEGCYSDSWSDWEMMHIELNTHPRELVDNLADKAHFGPVHKAPLDGFKLELKDHIGRQTTVVRSELLGDMKFEATYYGPAIQHGHYTSVENGHVLNAVMLNAHTPINQDKCLLHFGVMIDRSGGSEHLDDIYLKDYLRRSVESFMMDVRIWQHKRFEYHPVLCDGDGPIHGLRKWYAKFYTPRGR